MDNRLNQCRRSLKTPSIILNVSWHNAYVLHFKMFLNSFNKTEAAVFSRRLCFLRAFLFISLLYNIDLTVTYHKIVFKQLWTVYNSEIFFRKQINKHGLFVVILFYLYMHIHMYMYCMLYGSLSKSNGTRINVIFLNKKRK